MVKTISSHTFFFYPLSSGNWLAQLYYANMGKVTADAIRTRLMHLIRNSWKELQWEGINVDMIHNIENVAPILIDFQYEGSGDYLFSADISFMVKEQNNPFGMHRERFRIFPHSKMSIIETDIDFNIEVSSQLPLQKL